MAKAKKIMVVAAESQYALQQQGCDVDHEFDFIKDAKAFARRILTDEYHQQSESSTRIGYAQVLVDGECLYDFFGHDSESQSRQQAREERMGLD